MLRSRYLMCSIREHGSLPVMLLLLKWLYRSVRRVLRSRNPFCAWSLDAFCTNGELVKRFTHITK